MQETFPARLRALRRAKRLSQGALARLVDLHVTHIGRYERALSRPSASALSRLAEVLGVTTDYLFEGTTDATVKAQLGDRDLLLQFLEIEHLADDDKVVVKRLLDAFLFRKKVRDLVAR